MPPQRSPELSVVLPCLNEADTLACSIEEVRHVLRANEIDAEIIVADNHSIDRSLRIAERHHVRTVYVVKRGYGHALMAGIHAARGRYVIMGDTDGSHDFSAIPAILAKLREGYDLVNGNRFLGGIEPGAMSLPHRVGNKVLTGLGQLLFRTPLHDYNCGLRGFGKDSFLRMQLRSPTFGFAAEMILQATILHQRMMEIPVRMLREGRIAHPSTMHATREAWGIIVMMVAWRIKSLLGMQPN